MLTIKIENLKELRAAFEKAPLMVSKELGKATKTSGIVLQGIAVREAPSKTGALKRSIKWTYIPIVSEIYPTIKYAGWLHDGWKRTRPIFPTRKKALRFKTKSGKVVYVKAVYAPASYKGNKFMTRTAVKGRGRVNTLFNKALQNIIKQMSI